MILVDWIQSLRVALHTRRLRRTSRRAGHPRTAHPVSAIELLENRALLSAAPVFAPDTYTFGPINEDVAINTMIGTVTATDDDSTLYYGITAGDPSNSFYLCMGDLHVGNMLDFETTSSYTLTVRVYDTESLFDDATVTINVADVLEAPVFSPDTYTFSVAEDATSGTSVGTVSATDPQGDSVFYGITAGDPTGTFAVDFSGALTVQGMLDFETTSSYTLTVQATDMHTNAAAVPATVTVNITDVADGGGGGGSNNPPTISDIPDQTINEDALAGPISFTVGDVETPAASLLLSASSDNETLVPSMNVTFGEIDPLNPTSRTVTVEPADDQSGTATITVAVQDADGATDTDTFVLTVNAVNDPPVADAWMDGVVDGPSGTYSVLFGAALSLDGSESHDPDNGPNPLTYEWDLDYDGVNFNADVTGVSPTVPWSTLAGLGYAAGASETIALRVFDGADEDIATASVDVGPDAVNDSYTTDEDTPLTVVAPGLFTNDVGFGLSLYAAGTDTASFQGAPVNIALDGGFSFDPRNIPLFQFLKPGQSVDDQFNYAIIDGNFLTDAATVQITVTGVNDLPVAEDDGFFLHHSTAHVEADPGVLANDSDIELDTLIPIKVTNPANGTLTLNLDGNGDWTGGFTYTPNDGFLGTDSFTYKVNDGTDDSNIATVEFYVSNNAPTATDDVYYVLAGGTLDTASAGLASVLDNDTDLDGDDLFAVLVTGPSIGNLINLDANGHFYYIASATGTDTLMYQADDGAELSNVATVTIHVVQVSIKYPHGDPAASATNWNDKNSNEANERNERTFSPGNGPGVATVTVPVEAEVTPAAAAAAVGDLLRWEIDAVGPIQAEWSDHVAGAPQSGKGLTPTATFTTPATGLPGDNADFGTKEIRLSLEGYGQVDSTSIEIFYPRNDANHPGGDQTPAGQGSTRSTNWFYYWNQVAGSPDALFNSTLPVFGRTPAMRLWARPLPYPKSEIWLAAATATADFRRDGSMERVTGIDLFANVVAHENHHVQQIADADALLGALNGQANTIWSAGWSWNVAPNNHWTLGPDGQPGVAGVDDDNDGTIDERTDFGEIGIAGSDDVDLDNDDNDVPNTWEPATIEAQANSQETIAEHTNWQSDWGDPGKQHRTNQFATD